LTRTVEDAAMMMEVMAGPDDRDPYPCREKSSIIEKK